MTKTINNLSQTAASPGNFEVLVYLDDDDPQLAQYHSLEAFQPIVTTIVGPRYGYARLHEVMAQQLIPRAVGRWLFVFNDDATVISSHWDLELMKVSDDFVLCPKTNHPNWDHLNVFPVVPRKWVNAVGWSKDGASDTWWAVVSQMLGRVVYPQIEILHDREDLTGGHKDNTRLENNYDPKGFFTLENYARMGYVAGRIQQKFYA